MKLAFLPLLFVALLCGITSPAHALPDSVGVNPFLTQFDENFEDFASDPENFIITAAGRSHWKPVSTQQNIQELQIPAVVFGLQAKRIVLEESNNEVLRYLVQFDPALSGQNLLNSVLTNVQAYSGVEPVAVSETERRFALPEVTILVGQDASGLVSVEFRRNP